MNTSTFSHLSEKTRITISGDLDACRSNIGAVNKVLHQLRTQVSFQSVPIYRLEEKFSDGTRIEAFTVFGKEYVNFYVPLKVDVGPPIPLENYSLAYEVTNEAGDDYAYVICDWDLNPVRFVPKDRAREIYVLLTPRYTYTKAETVAGYDYREPESGNCGEVTWTTTNGTKTASVTNYLPTELRDSNTSEVVGHIPDSLESMVYDYTSTQLSLSCVMDEPYVIRTTGHTEDQRLYSGGSGLYYWDQWADSKTFVGMLESDRDNRKTFYTDINVPWDSFNYMHDYTIWSRSVENRNSQVYQLRINDTLLPVAEATSTQTYTQQQSSPGSGYTPAETPAVSSGTSLWNYWNTCYEWPERSHDGDETEGYPEDEKDTGVICFTYVVSTVDGKEQTSTYGYYYKNRLVRKAYPMHHSLLGHNVWNYNEPKLYMLELL